MNFISGSPSSNLATASFEVSKTFWTVLALTLRMVTHPYPTSWIISSIFFLYYLWIFSAFYGNGMVSCCFPSCKEFKSFSSLNQFTHKASPGELSTLCYLTYSWGEIIRFHTKPNGSFVKDQATVLSGYCNWLDGSTFGIDIPDTTGTWANWM